jgi:hypothetical protein
MGTCSASSKPPASSRRDQQSSLSSRVRGGAQEQARAWRAWVLVFVCNLVDLVAREVCALAGLCYAEQVVVMSHL